MSNERFKNVSVSKVDALYRTSPGIPIYNFFPWPLYTGQRSLRLGQMALSVLCQGTDRRSSPLRSRDRIRANIGHSDRLRSTNLLYKYLEDGWVIGVVRVSVTWTIRKTNIRDVRNVNKIFNRYICIIRNCQFQCRMLYYILLWSYCIFLGKEYFLCRKVIYN